jgi:ribonucleoside-diphosphate reductase alpha chain
MSNSTTRRSRLPARRASETFSFEIGGLHYRATVSRFPEDGCVAEIFLSNNKSRSQADANARDAAVAASLALQHGCPLDVLRGALLRDVRGRATTPLGVALDLVADLKGSPVNAGTV